MLNLFKRKPKEVKGLIGAWGLSDWWLNEFTTDEQNYIVDKLVKNDMFQRGNILTEGDYYYDDSELHKQKASLFRTLGGYATNFQKPETRHIAYKFIEKAERLISENSDVVDLHYYYHNKIGIYYRNRNEDNDALNKAIDACEHQIKIAFEAKKEIHKRDIQETGVTRYDIHHRGFTQLRIIEEKQGNYLKAIELAKEAMKQGWAGDWEKDIERLQKKLNK
jgi:hypothetical protein